MPTATTSGDQKHAEHLTPARDDWTRRPQVRTFPREGRLGAYRRMKAEVFRDRPEHLKNAVKEWDCEETREFVGNVSIAYARMRRSYLGLR